MRSARFMAVTTALTLTVALAACGSSEKTVDQQSGSGTTDNKGALVGVTMPTRSSERWIGDGDNRPEAQTARANAIHDVSRAGLHRPSGSSSKRRSPHRRWSRQEGRPR